MTSIELDQYLEKHPNCLGQGAGMLAERLHISQKEIKEAKQRYRAKKETAIGHSPKILLYDLETTPLVSYHWGRWKVNINPENTLHESIILAYTAKWLFADSVQAEVLTPEEIRNFDDKRLVEHLWKLIDQCDILIAYNGNRADNKWINSRFLVHNLEVPRPFFSVDPYQVVKSKFGFSSNKLDAIASYLGLEQKIPTTFDLWKECMQGNEKALHDMREYNIQDVFVLEHVYLRLRPYIKNHPNLANFFEEDVCPVCGSKVFHLIDGYYGTTVNRYPIYRCGDCGTVFRARKAQEREKAVRFTPCAH